MKSIFGSFWWWHFGCVQGSDKWPRFSLEFNITEGRAFLFKVQKSMMWLPSDNGWFRISMPFQVRLWIWRFEILFERRNGRAQARKLFGAHTLTWEEIRKEYGELYG